MHPGAAVRRQEQHAGSQGRWLGPILGGVLTGLLVILTLLVAVVLGLQEQILVAGVPTSTMSPTPHSPSTRSPTAVALVPAANTPEATARAVPTPVATATAKASSTAVPSTRPTAKASSTAVPSARPTAKASSTAVPNARPADTTVARCPVPGDWRAYTVQSGETLRDLAVRLGTSDYVLLQGNCLDSLALYTGQRLYVPPVPQPTRCVRPALWVNYVIKPGDTLWELAVRFETTADELRRVNCLVSNLIRPGVTLWVPDLVPTTTPTPTRAAAIRNSATLGQAATDLPSPAPVALAEVAPTASAP